jgi:thiosulfate dehydrogenase (quinone) large subunit
MDKFAYLIVRTGIALSMLGHGLVRIPQLSSWAEGMAEDFEGSLLPEAFVTPFFFILPFLEFLLGVFLILGLFTRSSAIVGGFLMGGLIFGTCLIENYGSIPSQMIHLLLFVIVIQFIGANTLALDHSINRKKA